MTSMEFKVFGLCSARPASGDGWCLEWQRSGASGFAQPYRRWHVLSYYADAPVRVYRDTGGRPQRGRFGGEAMGLYPAGEGERVLWRGCRVEALHLHLAPTLLSRQYGLRRLFLLRDRKLSAQMNSLMQVLVTGGRDGARSDLDSTVARIARYLTAHYLSDVPLAVPRIGQMPLQALLNSMSGPASATASLRGLAAKTDLSVSGFGRAFQRLLGMTPHRFLRKCRVDHAKSLLADPERQLGDIALDCGFYDQAHFGNSFRALAGLSPHDFRRHFSLPGR